jgi:cysteinyl-tRNA synthetase
MTRLFNTLTGTLEEFVPLEPGKVRMYNCGPTVYGTQHIGNLSMFVFTDVLRKTLSTRGFFVDQVINFTDFGHLTSDADEGEDKMTKGLRAEGLLPSLENMHKLGRKYAQIFLDDVRALNVETADIRFPYASEYVDHQIEMIKELVEKGFAYQGEEGLYFDTSKFPAYGKLGNINLEGMRAGARIGIVSEKRNPTDFILWKSGLMGWESPWGRGFPGWHIECSAMIRALLGDQIDIHTGGIEHIPVHHNNEIAQSEAATGKSPFSRFWLHRAHLQIDGSKIAKSEGRVVYLSDIVEKGFSPLAFRYFLLTAHYRTPTNFTWDGMQSAQSAYRKVKEMFASLPRSGFFRRGRISKSYIDRFDKAIDSDLNTPEALGVMWDLIKDETVSGRDKRATLEYFDKILGLDLAFNEFEVKDVPHKVTELLKKRETAKKHKNFKTSDEIRDEISALGYRVLDTDTGQKIEKN